MGSLRRLAVPHGVARSSRAWLLWLVLLLPLAHSLAAWHVYSHAPAESAGALSGKKHSGLADCGLCQLATNIAGAPSDPPALALADFVQAAPVPMPADAGPYAPQRRPFAIRAPPVLAI